MPSAEASESQTLPVSGTKPDAVRPSGTSQLFWIIFSIVFGGIVFGWAWMSGAPNGGDLAHRSGPLAVGPSAPTFSLTRQDEQTITKDDLLGKVWIADFIFTRCAGPCPKLSARMRSIQSSLAEKTTDVRLVSFTLDPENDKPDVLRRYANRFRADPDIWWFLTNNSEDRMHELVEKGFFQSVFPGTEDQPIVHSNYFVLVDRKGHIRAAHDGMDPASKDRVLRDLDELLAEPPTP